ncbi:hypothetical protein D9M68_615110 [compost metagenome]
MNSAPHLDPNHPFSENLNGFTAHVVAWKWHRLLSWRVDLAALKLERRLRGW